MTSSVKNSDQEASIMHRLSQGSPHHRGKKNMLQLLDRFEHEGPNGTHPCLVTEGLGPCVFPVYDCPPPMLPGSVAWEVIKQTMEGLAYMHSVGISHGGKLIAIAAVNKTRNASRLTLIYFYSSDLNTNNIFVAQSASLSDTHFVKSLGIPTIYKIPTADGQRWMPQHPDYLVIPIEYLPEPWDHKDIQIKIVIFDEAVLEGKQERKPRPPLVYRAPEAILTPQWDLRADIWSLGCTVKPF